tara:strand:- start:916 stop:1149 length:234 start_codon:yes stop_codon:yes gene_type:complete
MELIDTPNPNAKKIVIDEIVLDHFNVELKKDDLSNNLNKIEGVSSVFFGPGFVTITKEEDVEWESINQDITNIFDKL